MKKTLTIQTMVLGAIMATLICIATSFFRLPVAVTQGYIHLGDGLILLSAMFLGWVSIPVAAIGSMLADLLAGYVPYCLPTFVIKGLMAGIVVCVVKQSQPMWKMILGFVLAAIWMVLGYFLVEWLMLGYGLAAASMAIFPNMVQGISGIVIATALYPMMKRIFPKQ